MLVRGRVLPRGATQEPEVSLDLDETDAAGQTRYSDRDASALLQRIPRESDDPETSACWPASCRTPEAPQQVKGGTFASPGEMAAKPLKEARRISAPSVAVLMQMGASARPRVSCAVGYQEDCPSWFPDAEPSFRQCQPTYSLVPLVPTTAYRKLV